MTQTIARAQWNYVGYLANNKAIPNGPRPPTNLRITSGIRTIALAWDASKSTDVVRYNIYRKAGTNMGDFDKVGSIPASQTSFVDSLLEIGVSYYYYVTAANDGSTNTDPTCFGAPLESSKYTNRSYYPARAYRAAAAIFHTCEWFPTRSICIKQDFQGEADRLNFTNLSRRCVIRIFTVNGDLVKTIHKG